MFCALAMSWTWRVWAGVIVLNVCTRVYAWETHVEIKEHIFNRWIQEDMKETRKYLAMSENENTVYQNFEDTMINCVKYC